MEQQDAGQTLAEWLRDANLTRWHWQHLSDEDRPRMVILGRTIRVFEPAGEWFGRMIEQQKNAPKRLPGMPGAGRPFKKGAADTR